MKFRLLILFLCCCNTLFSQNLTGIWRGYFNSGYGYFKQQYKYEVQFNQLANGAAQKGLQGVTYSYRTTVFYGKANLQGIYDSKNKSLTLRETKLIELKIADKSDPCLMTCYLDYHKEGTTEILEGTFTSINANTNGDCGAGYVYLERVQESDFHKEDFLLKKDKKSNTTTAKNNPPVKKDSTKTVTKDAPKTITKTTPPRVKKTNPPVTNKPSSNNAKNNPVNNKKDTIVKTNPVKDPAVTTKIDTAKNLPSKIQVPIPDVIKQRNNALVKTITTSDQQIFIQLYDNGEIDGDTITVYDNNSIIAYKKGLTNKPINITVKANADDPVHEIVMVANNLGSIPPNTALMIVTTGGKRYELFISSDEKKNAKVIIQYTEPGKDSK